MSSELFAVQYDFNSVYGLLGHRGSDSEAQYQKGWKKLRFKALSM